MIFRQFDSEDAPATLPLPTGISSLAQRELRNLEVTLFW
jgi:hypothetical protein